MAEDLRTAADRFLFRTLGRSEFAWMREPLEQFAAAQRAAGRAEALAEAGWRLINTALPPKGENVLLYFPEDERNRLSPMVQIGRYPPAFPRKPTEWAPIPARAGEGR